MLTHIGGVGWPGYHKKLAYKSIQNALCDIPCSRKVIALTVDAEDHGFDPPPGPVIWFIARENQLFPCPVGGQKGRDFEILCIFFAEKKQ